MPTKEQIKKIKAGTAKSDGRFPLIFEALGDQGRFRIFGLLMEHHDLCVTDVAEVFGITISAASQQFKILERVGLVQKTRMGRKVCYEINQENAVAKQLVKLLKGSNK